MFGKYKPQVSDIVSLPGQSNPGATEHVDDVSRSKYAFCYLKCCISFSYNTNWSVYKEECIT